MLDAPLQILVGGLAAIMLRRRGDHWWLAAGKGALISTIFSTVLGVVLAMTSGTRKPKRKQRR